MTAIRFMLAVPMVTPIILFTKNRFLGDDHFMPIQSSPKTIIVTGSSTGFGRGTVEALTTAGHRVIASMRDIDGRNKAHADALRSKNIQVVELDVPDTGSVEAAIAAVLSEKGRL